MSNQVFPSLPGFDIKVSRSPIYSTLIQPAASGKELRASFQSYPRYRYTLNLNFARQAGFSAKTAYDELATIQRFLGAHMGAWDSFLFTDPADSSVTAHGFGTGDGTTAAFQLQRTNPGVYTDALGTWSVYTTPRTNLALYSEQLDNAWWTKFQCAATASVTTAPDGNPTADKISEDTTASSTHYCRRSMSLNAGVRYAMSVYAKVGERSQVWARSGSGYAYFDLTTGTVISTSGTGTTAGIQAVGNGWFRIWVAWTETVTQSEYLGFGLMNTASAPGGSTYTGDGFSGAYFWGAQIETGVDAATAYIPTTSAAVTVTPSYWPATGDGFEPITEPAPGVAIYRTDWQGTQRLYPTARTNLLTYSEQLDNAAWSKVGCTITANGSVAPDGTTTMDKVVESTLNELHWVRKTITLTAGVRYTVSAFVKAAERSQVYLRVGSGNVVFDLTTKAAVTTGGTGTTVAYQDMGGGIIRLSVSWTETTTQGEYVGVGAANGGTNSYLGDGTSGIYAWGLQLETSSVATAYIQTTSATVTVTDYTLSSTGLVTFATVPLAGAALTWTGSYYRRVRFAGDELEVERIVSGAWDGKSITLMSVK